MIFNVLHIDPWPICNCVNKQKKITWSNRKWALWNNIYRCPWQLIQLETVKARVRASLQSLRAPHWGLLPPVGCPPVERVRDSEGWSQSQFAVTETVPAGACGSYQASGWATSAEKQMKCQVGLEDNTAFYSQEKKLWVNIATCLASLRLSVWHNTEASTPYKRIKRRIYTYKEVLSFTISLLQPLYNKWCICWCVWGRC